MKKREGGRNGGTDHKRAREIQSGKTRECERVTERETRKEGGRERRPPHEGRACPRQTGSRSLRAGSSFPVVTQSTDI